MIRDPEAPLIRSRAHVIGVSSRAVPGDGFAQRRTSVADAAIRTIMNGGMARCTLKDVAAEGGWSTGVVQHYFRTKRDLILAAVERLASQNDVTLEQCSRAFPERALSALHAYCSAVISNEEPKSPTWWRVWVCLWAGAMSDPELAKAVKHHRRRWRAQLEKLIRAGQLDASIPVHLDAEREASRLARRIIGIGVDSIFEPATVPASELADELLAPLSPAARQ
jgi:AcrR family transcriptional regulator